MSLRDIQLASARSLNRLCSNVPLWTWAADKQLVPINEIFTDLVWVKGRGQTAVGNYTDMLKDEENETATFVFLQGLAGTGKSTLIQMMNVQWCRFIRRKWLKRSAKLTNEEATVFSRFKYVILIFLRYVKEAQTLQDVVQHQYGLGVQKVALLISKILQYPEESLIYLEGYDEYVESISPEITDIANRRTFREATLMITSRHSPSYHFLESHELICTPEKQFLLKGFNSAGVKQYVHNFFGETGKSKVVPLLDRIKESEDLIHMSKFPAILLLMCTLWEHEGSLADSITEFFLKFVAYVCGRFESKYVKASERATAGNIIEKYHSYLMKIGEVSVEGLREDKLQLSFPYRYVKHKIGDTAWQLGFLKREYHMEGEELVVFPHKTMQEFFTAYFVVHCDKIKQKELLIKFCTSVKAIKESEMIQTFLNGLGGEELKDGVNQILSQSSQEGMAKMIPALQLSYLAENRNAQLKLPSHTEIVVEERYTAAIYKEYMSMDCSAVTHLIVHAQQFVSVTTNAIVPALRNMSQLTELTFEVHSLGSGLESLCHVLSSQSVPLAKLDLKKAVGRLEDNTPWPMLMACLPSSIQQLDVSYNTITDESVRRLSQRLSHLKQLCIINMQRCNLRDAGAVLELIQNFSHCPSLTDIQLDINKLGDGLIEIVHLTGKMMSLRRLNLSWNGLSDHVKDRITEQITKDLAELELVV